MSLDKDKQAEEYRQLKAIMAQVFPGYEEYAVDSVTPSITGEGPMVSFMIVCNEEASRDFSASEDLAIEVTASVSENQKGRGKDLNLRFEFSFPLFSLQFFTAVEGENSGQQQDFAHILMEVDFFIIWLADKDKNLLKVLQVKWDKERHKDILSQF